MAKGWSREELALLGRTPLFHGAEAEVVRRAAEAGCTGAAEDLRALEADADAPQARKKGLLGRLFGS